MVAIVHIVEETRRAATAANDDILKFGYLMEHVVFDFAESFLTAFCEDLGNGLPHAALNIPIEIVEDNTQFFRKCLADGGLSGTHVAYEDDPRHVSPSLTEQR